MEKIFKYALIGAGVGLAGYFGYKIVMAAQANAAQGKPWYDGLGNTISGAGSGLSSIWSGFGGSSGGNGASGDSGDSGNGGGYDGGETEGYDGDYTE